MPITQFPDPRKAGTDGLVAVGGDLHPITILSAYRQGIFPWPMPGQPLLWFCPDPRAVLDFKDVHIPRSLAKLLKKNLYQATYDQAFKQVIEICGEIKRQGQDGTWITPEIHDAYCELHEKGYAHSFEVWEGDELVGGIYGVEFDGCFSGESMFHTRPNASKIALLELVKHLKSKGVKWMDIQMMTPHMESLGAVSLPRDKFLKKLLESRRPNSPSLF